MPFINRFVLKIKLAENASLFDDAVLRTTLPMMAFFTEWWNERRWEGPVHFHIVQRRISDYLEHSPFSLWCSDERTRFRVRETNANNQHEFGDVISTRVSFSSEPVKETCYRPGFSFPKWASSYLSLQVRIKFTSAENDHQTKGVIRLYNLCPFESSKISSV